MYHTDNILFSCTLKLFNLESHTSLKELVNLKELNFSFSPLAYFSVIIIIIIVVITDITITILDIIQHSVFYLKHDVLETEFCLHFQVEPTHQLLVSGDRD
jgi:hypothetical protein